MDVFPITHPATNISNEDKKIKKNKKLKQCNKNLKKKK